MKKNNKYIILVIVLFLFLSLSLFNVKKSYAIYRNSMNTKIHLSILDPSTSFTVTFDSHGGSSVAPINKTINQIIGVLPTSTRNNYNFIGWYTEEEGGTKITAETIVTANVTYHAHWVKLVCKKAEEVTLHTETCLHTTNVGCRGMGYKLNDTITYGTSPGDNSPLAGDAYNCDVNDDGTYDAKTE